MGFPAGNAHPVVIDKDKKGHADSCVEIGRWRIATRDKAKKVHGQNIDEHSTEQRHIFFACLAHGGTDESFCGVNNSLKEILQPTWHYCQASAHVKSYAKKHGHAQPGIKHMLEWNQLPADGELVHAQKC